MACRKISGRVGTTYSLLTIDASLFEPFVPRIDLVGDGLRRNRYSATRRWSDQRVLCLSKEPACAPAPRLIGGKRRIQANAATALTVPDNHQPNFGKSWPVPGCNGAPFWAPAVCERHFFRQSSSLLQLTIGKESRQDKHLDCRRAAVASGTDQQTPTP
jgi:hypothetical protein